MPKIIHQHLIKCGGTSLNSFLDTLVAPNQSRNPRSQQILLDSFNALSPDSLTLKAIKNPKKEFKHSRLTFHKRYQVLHGHDPLLHLRTEGDIAITFLRDPANRLLSQINDFLRLKQQDIDNQANLHNRIFFQKIRDLSLLEILELAKASQNNVQVARNAFFNLQCRQLGNCYEYIDHAAYKEAKRSANFLDLAKRAIEELVDFVGFADRMNDSFMALCYFLQCCPPLVIPQKNINKDKSLQVDDESAELIRTMNAQDVALYEWCKAQFDSTISNTCHYSIDDFEQQFALQATDDHLPYPITDELYYFNCHSKIVGTGFHDIDSVGTPTARVWTGPSTHAVLFFQVPQTVKLELHLVVQGYAKRKVKDTLKLHLNGTPIDFTLNSKREIDCKEVIVIAHEPTQPLVRLDIFSETFTDGSDGRQRGLCISHYGYRILR